MRGSPRLIAIFVLSAVPGALAAEPVEIRSASRSVSTRTFVTSAMCCDPGDTQRDSDLLGSSGLVIGDGTTAEASAVLISQVGASAFFATHGSVRATVDEGGSAGSAFAQTDYSVALHLFEPQAFSFDGSFTAIEFTNSGSVFWEAALMGLRDSADPVYVFRYGQGSGDSSESVGAAGLLMPGQYLFNVVTTATAAGGPMTTFFGRHNFNLSLSEPDPVPEPATMLLLGSGLASLAMYRDRRRRRH